MKRKNISRNALVTSIISLLLCVSMLVGTTFAWFTDEVVSGVNTIAAGNLDIELLANNEPVTENTKLFTVGEKQLWEPGVVVYENLEIKNVGSLALKYQMTLAPYAENATTAGNKLSEVVKIAVIDEIEKGATRADILAAAKASEKKGALADFFVSGTLNAGETTGVAGVVVFWEPNDNEIDNLYNLKNGLETTDGEPLFIEFSVKLFATQQMKEEDSFGPDYDSLAASWDGVVGEVPAADENGVVTITTAGELAALAEAVNAGTSYAGKTVKLGADINLGNKAWTPIGACDSKAYFRGTFDGQGHTIYNLNVDKSTDEYKYTTAGLFGWIDAGGATIKNVNLANATVKGSHWVGALVGYMTGTVENCSVVDSNITGYNVNDDANGDKIGGLVGYMNSGSGKLDGNTVKNTKVSGYRDVAGLAGAVATTNAVTNNKVEDVTVAYITATFGEIVSTKTAVVVDSTNTAKNVTIEKHAVVADSSSLQNALNAGEENIDLAAGTYKMPSSGTTAEMKITGTKDAVLDMTQGAYLDGAKVTIEGVTIKTGTGMANGNGSDYAALYSKDVTYIDCTFVGPMRLGRDGAKFVGCTFTELGNDYIWTNGNAATFENCTFNTAGKALLIYADGGSKVTPVVVKNCTFNATAGAKAGAIANQNCAAIEIHNYGCGVVLTTEGNTIGENFSGEWRIKTFENRPAHTITINGEAYTTIAIDGKLMTIDADRNVTVQ